MIFEVFIVLLFGIAMFAAHLLNQYLGEKFESWPKPGPHVGTFLFIILLATVYILLERSLFTLLKLVGRSPERQDR
jgi:hypothetical protein